jgi:dUTP pyrophosphatase
MQINIYRNSDEAEIPSNAYKGDAGFDLAAIEDVYIFSGKTQKVRTGIIVEIPKGYGGFILPRSGISVKYKISIPNSPGLIDSGYRGEVMVAMHNYSENTYKINKGDRIAQMVIMQVPELIFNEVSYEEISNSERGEGGFGSSGKN